MALFTCVAVGLCAVSPGRAGTVFSESFDSGSATYTVNDPYWTDQSRANGYIIQTTNSPSVWSGLFGTAIPQDASGTGYFLFEGTYGYNCPACSITAGQDQFYISPSFAVDPNTDYTVSFALADVHGSTTPYAAIIQPEIDGSLLGTPVSEAGNGYSSYGWQQFSFSWNSGSNTSASLILHDFNLDPNGNDFGIDNISVDTTAPEPASFLLAVMALALIGLRRKRQRTA